MEVYLVRAPNGKCYVGISKDAVARFHYHATHYKSVISVAIAKHGKDNMFFEVLEDGLSVSEARLREKYWIKYFGCIAPNGYNLTDGGEVGKTYAKSVKMKISRSRTGQVVSTETKEKISKTLKGRIISAEHRLKLSKALKGRKCSAAHRLNTSLGKKGKKPNRVYDAEKLRAAANARWAKYYARDAHEL